MGFEGNLVSDLMKRTSRGLHAYCSLGLVALFVTTWVLLLRMRPRSVKLLPPGPPGLPTIGNLHMLGKLPDRTLRDMAQKYGPILYYFNNIFYNILLMDFPSLANLRSKMSFLYSLYKSIPLHEKAESHSSYKLVAVMGFEGNFVSDMMKVTGGGLNGYSWSLALLALFVTTWLLWLRMRPTSAKLLPPGPPGLPLIGNLHMLGKLPHRTLRDMAQKYGPIMYLRLGSGPAVVASSQEMAKEFLKTHDLNFASRPSTTVGKNMAYNSTDIVFSPYGPYWRTMRKVCAVELLSPKCLESLRFVRDEEISGMIESVRNSYLSGEAVNVSKVVSTLTTDIICRMAFGKKYRGEDLDSKGFKEMIKEAFYLSGAINIGDFVPWLEWMDLQGLRRRQKNCHKTFDAFFEKIIEDHAEKATNKDFVDFMLGLIDDTDMEIKISRDNIKAVIFNMLGGGIDTTSATLEWAMSEMLLNPSIMRKVQEELETMVGLDRKVEESDLSHLKYLRAVVKETLRLYPPGPLLVPHESCEDCTISGHYFIPHKCRLIVNVWAIGRDPNSWEDANMFKPERFIGSPIDLKGQHFQMIPFGAGRRGCPGQLLGLTIAQYALANLLHCFDWRLPDGMMAKDLDMTEDAGLSMPRAIQLVAIATPRLKV